MTKIQKSFRFEMVDVEKWEHCAKLSGFSLSEWVRRRCNDQGTFLPSDLMFTEDKMTIPKPKVMIGGVELDLDKKLQAAKEEVRRGPRAFRPMKPDKTIDTSLCQHNMMKGACPRCK